MSHKNNHWEWKMQNKANIAIRLFTQYLNLCPIQLQWASCWAYWSCLPQNNQSFAHQLQRSILPKSTNQSLTQPSASYPGYTLTWPQQFQVSSSISDQVPVLCQRHSTPCINLTEAVVIVNSISPLEADISWANLSQTPSRSASLLFSANAPKKFFTVPCLSCPPVCFSSSATICFLSPSDNDGAVRIVTSFGSDFKIEPRDAMAFAVGSRLDCFAAAVYWHC